MKKIIKLGIVLIVLLSLCGCGGPKTKKVDMKRISFEVPEEWTASHKIDTNLTTFISVAPGNTGSTDANDKETYNVRVYNGKDIGSIGYTIMAKAADKGEVTIEVDDSGEDAYVTTWNKDGSLDRYLIIFNWRGDEDAYYFNFNYNGATPEQIDSVFKSLKIK